MTVVVLKFGGSFVGDINTINDKERLVKIANIIKSETEKGHQVVAVVSAMAGDTRRLKRLSSIIAPDGCTHEDDVILAAGEQVTAGLLAKLLTSSRIGIKARSLLAWQIPIETNDFHGDADISSINPDGVRKHLDEGFVVVVPGFQGVTKVGRITTLGFDGSDTTAVALAGALGARCCLYKDVRGVYTANPRRVPLAKKIATISYREMHVLAALGSRVLHPDAVKIAEKYNIDIKIAPNFEFDEVEGTVVTNKPVMHDIAGVTYSYVGKNLIQLSVVGRVLSKVDEENIIESLQQQKIVAEPITTGFTELSISIKIDWLEQLDVALKTLHTLYGLDDDCKNRKSAFAGVGKQQLHDPALLDSF